MLDIKGFFELLKHFKDHLALEDEETDDFLKALDYLNEKKK